MSIITISTKLMFIAIRIKRYIRLGECRVHEVVPIHWNRFEDRLNMLQDTVSNELG